MKGTDYIKKIFLGSLKFMYILFFDRYIKAVTNGEEPGVLLRLSDEVGLTPALLARTIVERHYQKADRSSNIFNSFT